MMMEVMMEMMMEMIMEMIIKMTIGVGGTEGFLGHIFKVSRVPVFSIPYYTTRHFQKAFF